MDFIADVITTDPDQPWVAHVSYIKPALAQHRA
jgi:hypothetical protein